VAYTPGVLWEAIFLLVILKIPVVYLCAVVWWAIKAEPTNEPPTEPVRVSDTPSLDPHRWAPSGARRPASGRGGPERTPASRPGAQRVGARR
jgi:hypothetical protein